MPAACLLSLSTPPALAAEPAPGTLTLYEEPSFNLVGPVTTGPDGDIWLISDIEDGVQKVTPSGVFSDFPTSKSASTRPYLLASGGDGNVWFTDVGNHAIDRLTPSGEVTAFSNGLNPEAFPFAIAAGTDGNMWFADNGKTRAIGKITPSGEITEYSAGLQPHADLVDLTAGPEGDIWFTDSDEDRGTPAIGKITSGGEITEYTEGLAREARPTSITAGPDGNVWFAIPDEVGAVGRITPSGTITEFKEGLQAQGGFPETITAGADGNLWFIDSNFSNKEIGRITPGGAITEFPGVISEQEKRVLSLRMAAGSDGRLWLGIDEGSAGYVGAIATGQPSGATPARVSGAGRPGSPERCEGASWPQWNGSPPSLGAFAYDGYSWQLDGTAIAGAQDAEYTPSAEDGGHQLTCRVTATYPVPSVTETSTSEPVVLAGGVPSATGTLTLSSTPVYSTATVECGGAKWSTANVKTEWLLDGAPIAGATGTSYVPLRLQDGHQLACRQTATSEEGQTRTLMSASAAVHEPAPIVSPDPNGITGYCGKIVVCIVRAPDFGFTYAHDDTWYSATPVECESAAWTSAAGDSPLEPVKGLAEAHTVGIRLERISAAGAVTLADVQLTRLTEPREEAQFVTLPYPVVAISYGTQTVSATEQLGIASPKAIGHPNPYAAGQGEMFYYLPKSAGPPRSFQLIYNLTAADLGSKLRCVAEAQDGPLSDPTTGVHTAAEVKVSTDPNCAPAAIAPMTIPQPLFYEGAVGREECVPKAAPGSERKATAELPKLPVIGGVAAIALNCNLPGGCDGRLEMTGTGAVAARAQVARKKTVTFAHRALHLAHGHRGAYRLRLSPAGQRLLRRAGSHGLKATLVLVSHHHRHTLGQLVLVKGARR